MRINFNKTHFKGYDAAPLKQLYISKKVKPILPEMEDVCDKENIKLIKEDFDPKLIWLQDYQVFLNKKSGETFAFKRPRELAKNLLKEHIEEAENLPVLETQEYVTGGNCFVGKNDKNEKWILIGESVLEKNSKDNISKLYEIKKENIIALPQQAFHIDMFTRPIGYPYILVDDFELAKENVENMDRSLSGYDEFYFDFMDYYHKQKEFNKIGSTIETLQNHGFKPIQIAGRYGEGINFINAIANKHSNNTISYITNSTKTDLDGFEAISALENIFRQDLSKKVKNLDELYFIKGKPNLSLKLNFMYDTLAYLSGGIHCLTLERPDFDN